jgi:hypothetical protein
MVLGFCIRGHFPVTTSPHLCAPTCIDLVICTLFVVSATVNPFWWHQSWFLCVLTKRRRFGFSWIHVVVVVITLILVHWWLLLLHYLDLWFFQICSDLQFSCCSCRFSVIADLVAAVFRLDPTVCSGLSLFGSKGSLCLLCFFIGGWGTCFCPCWRTVHSP